MSATNNNQCDYDHRWGDDDRGPLQFSAHYSRSNDYVPLGPIIKEIARSLNETIWATQWSEVEWKNVYYEHTFYDSDSELDDVAIVSGDAEGVDEPVTSQASQATSPTP